MTSMRSILRSVDPRGRLRRIALAVVPLGLIVLTACENPEPAVVRGDRLWADGSHAEALDEYRLALRQSARNDEVLLRVAHAYVSVGRFEEARENYMRLLARAPEYMDQAIHDFLSLAHRSLERRDRYDMAASVEAALELRPDLPLGELASHLARYYAELGSTDRALWFYERALAGASLDSIPGLLFEIGVLHEERRDCENAVGFFMAYRERAPRGAHTTQARWRLGQCSFELARHAHQEGRLAEALDRLDTVLGLGVPENIQDQAWFTRGEILFAIGRFDDALDAYRRVLDLNQTRGGLIVDRARQRIDQIRFGG